MRINEVYALLYESYRVMQSTWLEFMEWAEENEPRLANNLKASEDAVINVLGDKLDITVSTLAEAYEVFMKRNIKLDPLGNEPQEEHGDSSYWIRVMKQLMSMPIPDPDKDNAPGFTPRTRLYIEIKEFGDLMIETTDQLVKRAEDKKFKKKYKVIKKTPTWVMYKPEHRAAACHLGSGTNWCISARGEDNYYDEYAARSDIYIIHTANNKFAILIDPDGDVLEVQTEKNSFDQPTDETLIRFSAAMEASGVDVAQVEELLDIALTREWKLVDVDTQDDPVEITNVINQSSMYKNPTTTVSPNYVFADQKGKKTDEYSPDEILIARKKDGGMDVAYKPWGKLRPFNSSQSFNGQALTLLILKLSPAFDKVRDLPSEEKDEIIKSLADLLNEKYQIPPNQQVISVVDFDTNRIGEPAEQPPLATEQKLSQKS